MQNENIRRVTMRVYMDDQGKEFVTPLEYKSSELVGYSLVDKQEVILTFPKYNPREHQIRALEIRASLYGDNAKNKQVEIYEQIHKLGESDE